VWISKEYDNVGLVMGWGVKEWSDKQIKGSISILKLTILNY